MCQLKYCIVRNFHQGEIFAYFATKLKWWKINPWKFCMSKLNPLVAASILCTCVLWMLLMWNETSCHGSAALHDGFATAKCRALRYCWASFAIAAIDDDWTSKCGHYTKSSSSPMEASHTLIYTWYPCTNATLSFYTPHLPPPQSINTTFTKGWNSSGQKLGSEWK